MRHRLIFSYFVHRGGGGWGGGGGGGGGGWVREADISKCSRMPGCHPAFSEKSCLTLL